MALLRSCRCLLLPQQQLHQQLLSFSSQGSQGSGSSSSGDSSSGGGGSASSAAQVVPEAAAVQPGEGSPAAGSSSSRSSAAADEWTEVIDEKSGQTYFWNEKTGETTELGEPRPTSRFRDRHWEQAADTGPFQEGWREPPGRDLTYFYSALGTGIGVLVGWGTQYLH